MFFPLLLTTRLLGVLLAVFSAICFQYLLWMSNFPSCLFSLKLQNIVLTIIMMLVYAIVNHFSTEDRFHQFRPSQLRTVMLFNVHVIILISNIRKFHLYSVFSRSVTLRKSLLEESSLITTILTYSILRPTSFTPLTTIFSNPPLWVSLCPCIAWTIIENITIIIIRI